jgi:paraquat-inducible protein A
LTALQETIITCHECALSVRLPVIAEGQKAICPRCEYLLTAIHCNAVNRVLAFSVTALIFLILSLSFEFLSFSAKGLARHIDIIDSINILIVNDYVILAILQIIAVLVLPMLILFILLALYLPLSRGQCPKYPQRLVRYLFMLMPWSMVEIFLIGTLISLIKIISMANIGLGPSFYCFVLFSITLTAALLHIDKQQLTTHIARLDSNFNQNKISISSQKPDAKPDEKHHKKEASVQYTWALLITAIIVYIPANLLPIMNTRLLGDDDPSTILGGIYLLWQLGSYPIAIVIFIASVAVPVAKIMAMCLLNYSVQQQSQTFRLERTKLYRVTELVGRWSMVDVFVVIVLVSLIQLGNTMSIYPGAAVLAFSGMVILTMLAAMSFNPQLIWNQKDKYDH